LAAIDCYEHAKALGDLNLDGRIALCSRAASSHAPVECYKKARNTHAELSTNGAIALCSPALDLFVIQAASENVKGQKRLELQVNAIQAKLDHLARALD